MNTNQKLLSQMLEKFQRRHNFLPEKIVVAPVALVALGLKKSVAPLWEGVPVECRLFEEGEVATPFKRGQVKSLGIFAKEYRGQMRIAACDLINL
jgi:hypothetical protein